MLALREVKTVKRSSIFVSRKIFTLFCMGGPPNYISIKIKQKRIRKLKKVGNPWFE